MLPIVQANDVGAESQRNSAVEEVRRLNSELAQARSLLRIALDALIAAECPPPNTGEQGTQGCPVCWAIIRIDTALKTNSGEISDGS